MQFPFSKRAITFAALLCAFGCKPRAYNETPEASAWVKDVEARDRVIKDWRKAFKESSFPTEIANTPWNCEMRGAYKGSSAKEKDTVYLWKVSNGIYRLSSSGQEGQNAVMHNLVSRKNELVSEENVLAIRQYFGEPSSLKHVLFLEVSFLRKNKQNYDNAISDPSRSATWYGRCEKEKKK